MTTTSSRALNAGKSLKLYGERVALAEVDEVNSDGLHLPDTRQKLHMLCQVVSVGDGKVGEKEHTMWPKADDVILVQFNPMLSRTMAQKVKGEPLFVVHQNDCLARIANRIVSLETYEPLGRWVLVRVEFDRVVGGIELPVTDQILGSASNSRFYLEKEGPGAGLKLAPGLELYCDKTRVNPIKLGGKTFAYVDRDSVVGVHQEIID